MAELRPYTPTWRDTVASWMMGQGQSSPERRAFVGGLLGSTGLGNTGVGVVDATPVGGLLSMQEAGTHGDKLGMAANAASMLPMGKLAMFLGPGAKIADKVALGKAAEMERSGAAREAIWDATGWFKGVDGNWRFEIPDNNASITPWAKETHSSASIPFMKQQGKGPTALATDRYIEHPELERAYWPTSEDSPNIYFDTQKGPKDSNGVYFPDTDSVTIKVPYTDSKSVALHELQHAIQKREGFASGGAKEAIKKGNPGWSIYKQNPAVTLPEMTREQFAATLPNDPNISVAGSYYNYRLALAKKNKEIEKLAKDKASYEGYRRLSGEVEARTTQKRMDMTADERKARYPWLDYDVPENQQIVRFRGLLGK